MSDSMPAPEPGLTSDPLVEHGGAHDAQRARQSATRHATASLPDAPANAPTVDERFLPWSVSRHKQLIECERKDFYRRIASRLTGGAINPGEHAALERLKHLTELPLIGGRIQHDVVTEYVLAIRDGRIEPTSTQLLARARTALDEVWRDAETPDAWREAPNRVIGLREVIQRGNLRPSEVATTTERVLRCAETADRLPIISDLRQCKPGEILVYSQPVAFDLDGVWPMWAAPDVVYYQHDLTTCDNLVDTPTWCIVDFKSGQAYPDDERLQLAAYALFVSQQHGLPSTDGAYLGRIVRLGTELETWMLITRQDMDDVRRTVRRDRERIQDRLAAMPRTEGLRAAASVFAPAASPRVCARCVYAKGCDGARRLRTPATADSATRTTAPPTSRGVHTPCADVHRENA